MGKRHRELWAGVDLLVKTFQRKLFNPSGQGANVGLRARPDLLVKRKPFTISGPGKFLITDTGRASEAENLWKLIFPIGKMDGGSRGPEST